MTPQLDCEVQQLLCFMQMHTSPVAMCLVQELVQSCLVTSTVMEARPPSLSVAIPILHTPVPIVRMQGFSVNTDYTQVKFMVLHK